MRKKILALFCIIATLTLALVACDTDSKSEECTHTFGEAWVTDANNHWHAATCEHGEIKDSLAAHADVNEDAKCDVCAFEVGHDHVYEKDWSYDEEKHWKAATCSHTDVKLEESLHVDEGTDGVCDVCESHVHILDVVGFCNGCNKEIKPVDETDITAVLAAIALRSKNIVSGSVDYTNLITSSVTGDVTASVIHKSDYILGTNGTYINRTILDSEGRTVLEENWIPLVDAEEIIGVTTIKVDGTLSEAQPSAFSPDNLLGYYFTASALADGYGPEDLLYNLYTLSVEAGANKVSDIEVSHDADLNKYSYSYNILVINTDTAEGEDDGVTYYEVSIIFTYADDYELLTLDVAVDCYTNSLTDEREHDYTYDQATQTITMKPDASADTYHYVVEQVKGVREEIEIKDGSEYSPVDFEIYTDEALTQKAESVTITLGNNDSVIYIKCIPDGSFVSFLTKDFVSSVTDADGNESNGLVASLTGDVVYLLPSLGGEYTVTLTALGKTKTVTVTVVDPGVSGEKTIEVVGTVTYSWTDIYEFKAEETGYYTFYAPYGLGIWLASDITSGAPVIDPQDPLNPATSFTVKLRKGQTLKFYYLVFNADETYTIGYDFSTTQPE